MELETIKVPPFRLGLERDMSFTPKNAQEVYDGLLEGKRFEQGGRIEDENKQMVLNQAEGFEHHAEELEEAAKKADHVPAWVVAQSAVASSKLSDITHYLDGENEQNREMKEGEEYANGGMMAKGGNIYGIEKYLSRNLINHITSLNEEQLKKMKKELQGEIDRSEKYEKDFKGSNREFALKKELDLVNYRLEDEMAMGGYMASGGSVWEKNGFSEYPRSSPQEWELVEWSLNGHSPSFIGRMYFQRGTGFMFIEKENGEIFTPNYKNKLFWRKIGNKMAMGGMMAKDSDVLKQIYDYISNTRYSMMLDDYEEGEYITIRDRVAPSITSGDSYDDLVYKIKLFASDLKDGKWGDLIDIKFDYNDEWVGFDIILKQNSKMADGGYMAKGGMTDADKSKLASKKIAKSWQNVLDSNFDDEVYEKHEKLVKETGIPKQQLNKIQDYISITPKGQRRDIDIYQFWDVSEKMAMGGVTFKGKVRVVKSSLLKGKKVSPKVQKDYGKTYSKKEAQESAERIVGAMTAKERLMKSMKKGKK
jgi:hypothetical protein